jgi:two-component system sensor histidine kinase UhpB
MPNENVDKYFLASIVESSNDSIITINLDLEITSWNRSAEALYGYTAEEAIGKRLTTLTLPKDFQQVLINIDKIKESKQVEVFESERVGKNKEHMILDIVISPVKDESGEIIGLSTVARDLTERRRAEKAGRDKEILHRLIIAQEDERSRISRDLHDELGQQLTALRLKLERVRLICRDEEQISKEVDEMVGLAESIDKSVDFLAWELRPAILEGVGLAAAIDNYLEQWSQHSGVESEPLVSGLTKVRLAAKVETNLYRIMQEALNNTHKHAKATRVELMLEKRGDAIVLIISDDGSGFSLANKKKRSKGLGLTGMRERAALVGGTLSLESSPGKGTTIQVSIPITPRKRRKTLTADAVTTWRES